MADERSNEALHPTKEVRITGERSATLVGMAIQASRVDTTILQMKMAGSPETRRRANEAADRFERALNAFDAEMREVNKDLNLNRNGGQSTRTAQQSGQSKQAPKPVLQKAKKGGEQQALAQGTAKATQTGQQKRVSGAKPLGQQQKNSAGPKTDGKPQQPAGSASKAQKPAATAVNSATPVPEAAAEAQA